MAVLNHEHVFGHEMPRMSAVVTGPPGQNTDLFWADLIQQCLDESVRYSCTAGILVIRATKMKYIVDLDSIPPRVVSGKPHPNYFDAPKNLILDESNHIRTTQSE